MSLNRRAGEEVSLDELDRKSLIDELERESLKDVQERNFQYTVERVSIDEWRGSLNRRAG